MYLMFSLTSMSVLKTSSNECTNVHGQHWNKYFIVFWTENPKVQLVWVCSGSFTTTYFIFVTLENIT